MTNLTVLEKTACLSLRISRWTGRSRLRVSDLGEAALKMPPEDLASLGTLKLCSPKHLRHIGAIQRAAERDCARVCARFLGGYATEKSKIPDLVDKLTKHQEQYLAEAASIAQNLRSVVDDWAAQHPAWKDVINQKVPDADDIKGRFSFEFQAYKVGPASSDPSDVVNCGLEDAALGLSGQLFKEIEAEANQAWKASFEGRTVVGQRALRPLKAILEKLETLSYVDQRCQPIIAQFQRVLASLPKSGPIADPYLSAVIGLFRIVQSRDVIRSHGSAVLKNREASSTPSDLFANDTGDDDGEAAVNPSPDVGTDVSDTDPVLDKPHGMPSEPRRQDGFWI